MRQNLAAMTTTREGGGKDSMAADHDDGNSNSVVIGGKNIMDDHSIIADVLNEVNGFIDSLDQGESFSVPDTNEDDNEPAAVGNGGGDCYDYDPVNDSEELFSIMSSRYNEIVSPSHGNMMSNATADKHGSGCNDHAGRDNADADGADALNESQELYSTLSSRYQNMAVASDDNDTLNYNGGDGECGNKNYRGYKQSHGEDEKGLEVFGLTREPENSYINETNQPYQNINEDGHSNRAENSLSPNSISKSSNSGGGSSVENMPPSLQQQNQQKPQHTPSYSYHQSNIQPQKHQPQQIHQKSILQVGHQHQGGRGASQLSVPDQSRPNVVNNRSTSWEESYANRMGVQEEHASLQRPISIPASASASVSVSASASATAMPSSLQVSSPFSASARQLFAQGSPTQFGLQNCRKVSLLLKVSPHPQMIPGHEEESEDQVDEDGYGPILFPALMGQEAVENAGINIVVRQTQGDTGDESNESQLKHGEVILVNPNAFDAEEEGNSSSTVAGDKSKKRIAGRVTVETARLVAEVSQISSEDWARKYQFDDVSWPSHCKSFPSSRLSSTSDNENSCDALSALAMAAVEDVLSLSRRQIDTKDSHVPCSSVICAVGGTNSGKTTSMFGSTIAKLVSSATRPMARNVENDCDGQDLGLLGEIISGILSSTQKNIAATVYSSYPGGKIVANGPTAAAVKCSLSVLEIADDDVLRDVLGFSEESWNEHGGTQALRVRHLDKRGASVLNLRQVTIESMGQLHQLLRESFKYNPLRKLWSKEGGHGHFIATIGVSRPGGSSEDCAKIQLVDLASPDRHASSSAALGSIRKSLSALRGVLKGIIQHDHQGNSPLFASPIPYRESTLTKLLQRSLEDQCLDGNRGVMVSPTRAVVIGTVCPSSKNYNQTLGTMDFMTRLWSKPGVTAQGPFTPKNVGQPEEETAGGEERSQHDDAGKIALQSQQQIQSQQHESQSPYRKSSIIMSHHPHEALQRKASLKSLTSDPRQRLAKLLNTAPLIKADTTKSTTVKGDNVHNYDDLTPPKNSSVFSDEPTNNQQRFRDSYGNVFDQLDSLMDASDDGSIDRNSYGEEIIEALTPYKTGRAMNDRSSFDSSEGVTPSPRALPSPYNNGGSKALKQKQHEEQRRIHELYHGVMERGEDSGYHGNRHNLFPIKSVDEIEQSPIRTEIQFHRKSDSSHSSNVSRLGNELGEWHHEKTESDQLLTGNQDNSSHLKQNLDRESSLNCAGQSHDRLDHDSSNENYLSKATTPDAPTEQEEPPYNSNEHSNKYGEKNRARRDQSRQSEFQVIDRSHSKPNHSSGGQHASLLQVQTQQTDVRRHINTNQDGQVGFQAATPIQSEVACHRRTQSDNIDPWNSSFSIVGNKKDLDESSHTWSYHQAGGGTQSHQPSNSTQDGSSITSPTTKSIPRQNHVAANERLGLTDEISQIHAKKDDAPPASLCSGTNDDLEVNFSVPAKASDMNRTPMNMLLSPDSLDAEEPLVSTKSKAPVFFCNSPKQQTNALSLPPVNSADVRHSPTFTMFESFKLEIDSLVNDLTSPRGLEEAAENVPTHNDPAPPLQASTESNTPCNVVDSAASNDDRHTDTKCRLIEDEVTSLKAKVQSLMEEKTASENFMSRMHSIMSGNEDTQGLSDDLPSPSWHEETYKTFEDTITKKQTLLINLRCQLEVSQAESVKLSSELQQAETRVTDLTHVVDQVEEQLAEAKETIDSQAGAFDSLESQLVRVQEQLNDVTTKNVASSVYFGQLDALLGISNDGALVDDESQHKFRLDTIKSLQIRLQEELVKFEDSLKREQLAKDAAGKLASKVQELEDQTRTLQESRTRIEAKRLEAEKLAEEAISAHEALTIEVTDLQSSLAKEKKDREELLAAHKTALEDNERISTEYDKTKALIEDRDHEISKLKSSFHASHEEKTQLENQLNSIRTKTVEVMKQRIVGLKADYTRRLDEFKASHLEQENEGISRLRHDLSQKEADNANLKRRMEQIEKSASLKLQNTNENLGRVQRELDSKNSELFEAREEKKALQSELDHLRSLIDIAEESVNELNRLKEENKQLNDTIKLQDEQDSHILSCSEVPFEIRGKRSTNDNSFYDVDNHFMHERISALMRENEQNNISMRTLQSENVALRSSIEECTRTIKLMHSEMNGLKMIATNGVSKIRLRENSLLDEHRKDRDAIAEMEKKLTSANNLIRSLRSSRDRYYDGQGGGLLSNLDILPPPSVNGLKTPEEQRSALRSRLEQYHDPPSGSAMKERKFAAELSTEKELRFKAEEICAGVLANSKAALEERDSEISKLRAQLFKISSKRHRGDK